MNQQPQDWDYVAVPNDASQLFDMCWQIEQWLRTIVYVELRANRVDWEKPIRNKVKHWPPRSLANDKRLHHMATPHQAGISYLTFGQLWEVILSPESWHAFAPYFPPKDNTNVRIAEVKAIRNRIAHFREPHPQDTARLELFLRDMEPGIRRFCNRYTVEKIPTQPSNDPISEYLEEKWENIGYGIELKRPIGWLYAIGPTRMNPKMHARLQMHFPNDYNADSLSGVIYRITLVPSRISDWQINAVSIFNGTKHVHDQIIHFSISNVGKEVSATIPAVLGTERTSEIVSTFLRAGLNSIQSSSYEPPDRERLKWPEYVLWPDNMLTLFIEEMSEPILQISSD